MPRTVWEETILGLVVTLYHRTSGGQEVSYHTIHLDLNGDGEQDVRELMAAKQNPLGGSACRESVRV